MSTTAERIARAWLAHHTKTSRMIVPAEADDPLARLTPHGTPYLALVLEHVDGVRTILEERTRTVVAREEAAA